jgi:hypothetical protein
MTITNPNGGTMENSTLAALLQKNIDASNRTTHAVRALVLFLFIQLVGLTIAFVLNSLATASYDPVRCAVSGDGCEPIVGLQVLAFLVWVVAVIWSSNVGWREIGLSNPIDQEVSAPAINATGNESDQGTSSNTQTCSHCGAEKWARQACYECGM